MNAAKKGNEFQNISMLGLEELNNVIRGLKKEIESKNKEISLLKVKNIKKEEENQKTIRVIKEILKQSDSSTRSGCNRILNSLSNENSYKKGENKLIIPQVGDMLHFSPQHIEVMNNIVSKSNTKNQINDLNVNNNKKDKKLDEVKKKFDFSKYENLPKLYKNDKKNENKIYNYDDIEENNNTKTLTRNNSKNYPRIKSATNKYNLKYNKSAKKAITIKNDDIIQKLNEEIQKMKKKITQLQNYEIDKDNEIKNLNLIIKNFEIEKNQFLLKNESLNEEIQKMKEKINELQISEINKDNKIKNLNLIIENFKKEKNQFLLEKESLIKELQKMKEIITQLQNSEINKNNEIKNLNMFIENFKTERNQILFKIESLNKELKKEKDKNKILDEKIINMKNDANKFIIIKKNLDKENDDLKNMIINLKEEIKLKENLIIKLNKTIEELNKRIEALENELNSCKKNLDSNINKNKQTFDPKSINNNNINLIYENKINGNKKINNEEKGYYINKYDNKESKNYIIVKGINNNESININPQNTTHTKNNESELQINENIKYIKNIFWFDDTTNSEEYKLFKNKIGNLAKIFEETEINKIMEKSKFETNIIILNANKFPIYANYLINNSLYFIPISIIYTRTNSEFIDNIDNIYKKYLEDKFYNSLGISNSIENLIMKINNFLIDYGNEINKIILGNTPKPTDYKDCYSFDYIDNEEKLTFQYLYDKIMKNSKINIQEIKETNKFMLEKYGQIDQLKNLVFPLLTIDNIPINVIAKFWGRIYTLDCSFYRNLNNNLMKDKDKDYNTYIRILYKGLKEFEYNGNEILYRGTQISNDEIKNIYAFYANRKKDDSNKEFIPSYLIYSKAYLSFSKKKHVALRFIQNAQDIPNTKKILFQLKNNTDNKILSNADLFNISALSTESEVLFFPFSSFIIDNIKDEGNICYIDLIYFGIYENKIKKHLETKNEESLNEIMIKTKYYKDVFKSGIIPKKIENNLTNFTHVEENLIENILKDNSDKNKNEIICTFNKQKDTIYLLGDFTKDIEEFVGEEKELYKEGKNNINWDNIEIYINDKKIDFCYKYLSYETGEIKVKFVFNKFLTSTYKMFAHCDAIEYIDLSSFKSNEVTNMNSMFYGCSSLKEINLFSLDTTNVKDMCGMFGKCSSLQSLDLISFNTTNIKNMSYMFFGCNALKSLNLSSFNTSNVTNMNSLFSGCTTLESIDLSSFNTTKVKDMGYIFCDCKSLKLIDLSSFNTSLVNNMVEMFSGCISLESLDLSKFNTINVNNMKSMFSSCSSLESLDLSSFNTTNLKYMSFMFSDCSSLVTLNLSSFDTTNVTDMDQLFQGCSSLRIEHVKIGSNGKNMLETIY